MRLQQLQPATSEAATTASWLIQALPAGLFTLHGGAISGFAATTRLLHPATDVDGNPTS